jgi:hypothetical protein
MGGWSTRFIACPECDRHLALENSNHSCRLPEVVVCKRCQVYLLFQRNGRGKLRGVRLTTADDLWAAITMCENRQLMDILQRRKPGVSEEELLERVRRHEDVRPYLEPAAPAYHREAHV